MAIQYQYIGSLGHAHVRLNRIPTFNSFSLSFQLIAADCNSQAKERRSHDLTHNLGQFIESRQSHVSYCLPNRQCKQLLKNCARKMYSMIQFHFNKTMLCLIFHYNSMITILYGFRYANKRFRSL